MHPALGKLMMLTLKSNFRRFFRGARTLRGAFLIIFTLGFFSMMIVPGLLAASVRDNPAGRIFSGVAEPYLAPGASGHHAHVRFHLDGREGPLLQPFGS